MKALNRRLIVLVIAMLVGSGLGAGASSVATAQPQNFVHVMACVEFSNGAPYALKPLYLLNRLGNEERNGETDASGCGTFYNVPANSYYSFEAVWSLTYFGQNWEFRGVSIFGQCGDPSTFVYWDWGTFVVEPYLVS